jgi:hypothetical protein
MSRAGGKTIRRARQLPNGTLGRHFEIAIATRMLFLNFKAAQRPVTVCGMPCPDRMSALQRIMEHEILHLAEFLYWGKSSCAMQRFKRMAINIFGHGSSKHDLITAAELLESERAINVGTRVEFEFEGKTLAGFVNRVQQRVTVLVESLEGERYSDGKAYQKYLVPVRKVHRAKR